MVLKENKGSFLRITLLEAVIMDSEYFILNLITLFTLVISIIVKGQSYQLNY